MVMRSPGCRPTVEAGLPGVTDTTSAPFARAGGRDAEGAAQDWAQADVPAPARAHHQEADFAGAECAQDRLPILAYVGHRRALHLGNDVAGLQRLGRRG